MSASIDTANAGGPLGLRREDLSSLSDDEWSFMCKLEAIPGRASLYEFVSARQGKRELYEFVQELRQLRACMAADPLPEEVMVTVFMNGLALGEARRAVFQSEPRSLEEAMYVAQRADHYDRLARGLPVGRQAGPQDTVGDPEPMDLTLSEEHLNALEAPTWRIVRMTERHVVAPLQSVIFALLEASVTPKELSLVEANRGRSARLPLDSAIDYSPSEKATLLVPVTQCIYWIADVRYLGTTILHSFSEQKMGLQAEDNGQQWRAVQQV
ncbi:hypothetical protein ATCC90586_007232 [Pythium insidiosum]|nr:hypothetical protein ATCC90586_007232 [Pythium insidiosum]